MRYKKIILFFSNTLLAAFCFAQTAFSPDVLEKIAASESRYKKGNEQNGITLAPSANYDVKFAQMQLHPYVENGITKIEGSVTYSFLWKDTATSNKMAFDFATDMKVNAIEHHVPATIVEKDNNILTIHFAGKSSNTTDTITIVFNGTPEGQGLGSFASQREGTDSSQTIWTLSEPYGARDWFPCKMTLSDKLDSVDILIQVDSPQYMGISNGLLKNVYTTGGSRYYHWRHSYPIATYLIALAVAKYEVIDTIANTTHGLLPIKCFSYRDKKQEWQNDVHHVVDCMQLFDTLLGKYPFSREYYGETQFAWGGGMEHQSNSFMYNLGFELVAHEMAHQWFGDKITCGSWQDIWLNEGFATYCSGLAYEHIQPQWWRAFRETTLARAVTIPDGSVYVDDTTNVSRIFSGYLTYSKGAYVLHSLRWLLGDSLFFTSLHSYLNDERLAYNFATTENLQQHFEAVSGKELTYYFNQWIYGKGFPQYKLLWTKNGSDIEFQLFQSQSDASVSFFKMPVPVYVQSKNGSAGMFILDHTFSGEKFSVQFDDDIDSISIDPELWLISKNNEVWQLNDLNDASEISLFPNPATNRLSVIINSAKINSARILIYDMSGKLVIEESVEYGQFAVNINVASLTKGTYTCKLTGDNHFLNAKAFVKE